MRVAGPCLQMVVLAVALDTLQTLQSLKLASLSSLVELADAQSKVVLAKPQYAAVLVPVLSHALGQLCSV